MIGLVIAREMYHLVHMVVQQIEKRIDEEERVNCMYGEWGCKWTRGGRDIKLYRLYCQWLIAMILIDVVNVIIYYYYLYYKCIKPREGDVSHLDSYRSEREDELIDVRGNIRRCWWESSPWTGADCAVVGVREACQLPTLRRHFHAHIYQILLKDRYGHLFFSV